MAASGPTPGCAPGAPPAGAGIQIAFGLMVIAPIFGWVVIPIATTSGNRWRWGQVAALLLSGFAIYWAFVVATDVHLCTFD
jgi:hypothetical protein